MNDADKALASVKGIDSLLMEGKGLRGDLADAMTLATVEITTDGAPTLALGFSDPHREILRSGIWGKGVKTNVDGHPFEAVAVSKSGSTLSVTLEHEVAAALRRHNDPIKVAAGTTTHVAFARRLVAEEKWVQFVTGGKAVTSRTALTRGIPASSGPKMKRENTWDCLARIAGDRGWRRFVRGASELLYVPDEFLFGQASAYTLSEDTEGVDTIDFDYDSGKRVGEVTVNCRAARWKVPPGQVVTVKDCGPADGKWLVVSISRSLFSVSTSITLHKPQPVLPEPKPQKKASSSSGGGTAADANKDGLPDTPGTVSATDFVNKALGESGRPYVWGGTSPSGFDCSGLVEWTGQQLGVAIPRTSGEQYEMCRKAGTLISIDKAEHTKGALLFEGVSGSQHVVISLGDGRTIEARGTAYGTGSFSAIGRPWSAAGLIPGVKY